MADSEDAQELYFDRAAVAAAPIEDRSSVLSEFILMLTKDDVTVPDAVQRVKDLSGTGIKHIGFKDVGLPVPQMRALTDEIRGLGCAVHLEVVSLDEEAEIRSAQVAVDLEVDYLLGGSSWQRIAPMARDAGIAYFPYVGEVIGHPASLSGSTDLIVSECDTLLDEVSGINLLAFRHVSLDGLHLTTEVVRRTSPLPVVCAGSIASLNRVATVREAGAWAFTIGGAAMDREIVPGGSLGDQVTAVLAVAS